MEKKKAVQKICLMIFKTAIIVFLIIALNLVFMPKYLYENQDGRITAEFYREKLDTDIIFVGSSTVYSGVSPIVLWEEYGFTSYNRSNASQPIWISYYMIKDAIKCNKPRLVVLDIGFIKYWDTYAEEPANRKAIDGMRFSKTKLECIEAAKDTDEKLSDYLFPIFRFHTRWKELGSEDFFNAFYSEPVTYNGFLMDFRETKKLPKRDGYVLKDNTEIGIRNISYLCETIELCQKEDVQIMLMKMPSYSDNWSFDYDYQINKIAAEYGITYINFDQFSSEIGLDYLKHSPDEGNHLNTPGAELFTSYLGTYIDSAYHLPSHAEEEDYRKVWNAKVLRYQKDLAARKEEISD